MAAKERVYARIEPELAETIDQQCQKLGITKQAFMVSAVIAELGRFDVRTVLKLATDERDKMQAERDKVRKDREIAREWRDTYKSERNRNQSEANQARQQRDIFKEASEKASSELQHANAVIKAYEKQSWFGRLVGIKPKVPDYPTTETSVSHSIL